MRKVGMGVNQNSADLAAENAELKKKNADLAAENVRLLKVLKKAEKKGKTDAGEQAGAAAEGTEVQNHSVSDVIAGK